MDNDYSIPTIMDGVSYIPENNLISLNQKEPYSFKEYDNYNQDNMIPNYKGEFNRDKMGDDFNDSYYGPTGYNLDSNYIMDSNYKFENIYHSDMGFQNDENGYEKSYNVDSAYDVVRSTDSTNTGMNSSIGKQSTYPPNMNTNYYDYMSYYNQYPYYMNGSNAKHNLPTTVNPNSMNVMNQMGFESIGKFNDITTEHHSNGSNNEDFITKNMIKEGDKFSNSTIENESIEDIEDKDGTKPPANRSDPIYTAISGLKWKSKSKKWVVRWDNPITNRRVYKYFSGTRYGFMGAHKRAKYYLEFLNASVGKINSTTPGNPFCRRTEGPPKGKNNKSLIRKFYNSQTNMFYYQNLNQMNRQVPQFPNFNYNPNIDSINHTLDQTNINDFKTNPDQVGSNFQNPWYINGEYNNQ